MENNYSFTEFKSVGGRFKPIISLGRKSGWGISSGFCNAYDIKDVVGVKMYYDEQKNAVGFKFLKTKEDGMVNAKISEKGGYIAGQSFIGKFRIDQNKYWGRYIPKEIKDDDHGKIYVIELKENDQS